MALKDIKTVTINIGEPLKPFSEPVPASVEEMIAMGEADEVAKMKAAGDLVLHKGVWCWSLETIKAAKKEMDWR